MMSPDMRELVSAATVIKVTVCEDNMERLAWGWPQSLPTQIAGEAVDPDTRVNKEVALTPLEIMDL